MKKEILLLMFIMFVSTIALFSSLFHLLPLFMSLIWAINLSIFFSLLNLIIQGILIYRKI